MCVSCVRNSNVLTDAWLSRNGRREVGVYIILWEYFFFLLPFLVRRSKEGKGNSNVRKGWKEEGKVRRGDESKER